MLTGPPSSVGQPHRNQTGTDLNVKGLREGALDDGDVGAVPLVGADDGIGAPVGPVDVALEQGDGERVRQRLVAAQDLARVPAVVARRVDRVRFGVDPVDPPRHVVQRQAVGPRPVRHVVHLSAVKVPFSST